MTTKSPIQRISRRPIVAGVIGAAFVLFALVIQFARAPQTIAAQFARSQPALEAFAARVMAADASALANPPQRLGDFDVGKVEPLPHGFLFESRYGNPFDWTGLAYSAEPLPPQDLDQWGRVRQTFTPISGNWYEVWRQ